MTIEVSPIDASLGAVVRGVALAGDVPGAVLDEILAAWHDRAVLVLPDQHLDRATQAAFSRRLGPLEDMEIYKRDQDGMFINEDRVFANISNVMPDGSLVAPKSDRGLLLKGNTAWHTDSSFKRVAAKASLLNAQQVPSHGGETSFADMRAAYEALDAGMRAWLDDKIAVHDQHFSQSLVGGDKMLVGADRLPPVEHPVIRTHPITGRKSLYVGRHASHIVGEDVEESRALLRKLCEDACQPPRVFTHQWAAGDLVMWDNRCVLHRGHAYPSDQARVMVRTTVAGDAPDNEWAYDRDVPINSAA